MTFHIGDAGFSVTNFLARLILKKLIQDDTNADITCYISSRAPMTLPRDEVRRY